MLGLGTSLIQPTVQNEAFYSVALDGSGDYISLGNINGLLTSDFTISWWEQVTDVTPTTSWYGFIDGPSNSTYHNTLSFSKQSALYTSANFQHSATSSGAKKSTPIVYPWTGGSGNDRDVWRHHAIQGDPDGGDGGVYYKFNYYTDGALSSIVTNKTPTSALVGGFGTLSFYLGARNSASGAADYETGNFAEVAIHGAYLDADNIAAMYNSGNAGLDLRKNSGNYTQKDALVRYYRFTEGTGTTLVDATGNADATIVNGTWDLARNPTTS